jgi:hypothetical protein
MDYSELIFDENFIFNICDPELHFDVKTAKTVKQIFLSTVRFQNHKDIRGVQKICFNPPHDGYQKCIILCWYQKCEPAF